MDWDMAIERNTQALKRILMTLVAMAALGGRATLPRQLRNAVLRLLRPAEAAARRLVIVMARGLVAPPPRSRKIVVKPLRKVRQFMPVMPPKASARPPVRSLALPLLDPLRRKAGRRWVRRTSVPRIGLGERRPLAVRPLPSPDDQLDATRLGLRLDALALALDDLPGHARRFVRWQTRQKRVRELGKGGKAAFRWPLRWGRPPGSRRRSKHEVHDVLTDIHELAREALERFDTS